MRLYKSQRNLLLGGGTAAGVIIFLAIVVGLQYIAKSISKTVGPHQDRPIHVGAAKQETFGRLEGKEDPRRSTGILRN